MAKILNVSYRDFYNRVQNKKIVLWGAGKLASYYIRTILKNLNVISIIDKNDDLCGKELLINGVGYPVIREKDFMRRMENDRNDVVIFITPMVYAGEIIKHINTFSVLNSVECYVGALMREFSETSEFVFSTGEEKIPKKLHYCWFGKKDIPEHLKSYMESWHKFCPDYEIIRWDETNYDVSKSKYMREAYECKYWAFVPDYARLDIIYNEGGIYLDTDVEILTSLDKLLCDEMFCGFGSNFQVAIGVGFGAIKNHTLIKELRDYYEDKSFYLENGELNLKTCYEYQHPVLEKFGFKIENRFQKKDGVVLYPSDVFLSDMGLISKEYTNNTILIHHNEYSWASEKEKKTLELFKEDIRAGRIKFA